MQQGACVGILAEHVEQQAPQRGIPWSEARGFQGEASGVAVPAFFEGQLSQQARGTLAKGGGSEAAAYFFEESAIRRLQGTRDQRLGIRLHKSLVEHPMLGWERHE